MSIGPTTPEIQNFKSLTLRIHLDRDDNTPPARRAEGWKHFPAEQNQCLCFNSWSYFLYLKYIHSKLQRLCIIMYMIRSQMMFKSYSLELIYNRDTRQSDKFYIPFSRLITVCKSMPSKGHKFVMMLMFFVVLVHSNYIWKVFVNASIFIQWWVIS